MNHRLVAKTTFKKITKKNQPSVFNLKNRPFIQNIH